MIRIYTRYNIAISHCTNKLHRQNTSEEHNITVTKSHAEYILIKRELLPSSNRVSKPQKTESFFRIAPKANKRDRPTASGIPKPKFANPESASVARHVHSNIQLYTPVYTPAAGSGKRNKRKSTSRGFYKYIGSGTCYSPGLLPQRGRGPRCAPRVVVSRRANKYRYARGGKRESLMRFAPIVRPTRRRTRLIPKDSACTLGIIYIICIVSSSFVFFILGRTARPAAAFLSPRARTYISIRGDPLPIIGFYYCRDAFVNFLSCY